LHPSYARPQVMAWAYKARYTVEDCQEMAYLADLAAFD
jgi:hypothetical protein